MRRKSLGREHPAPAEMMDSTASWDINLRESDSAIADQALGMRV